MNKQKPVCAVRICLLIWLFVSVCLFRPLPVAADETDLYHESLKFDSEGNLLMTTRDKKASSSVRYKTIGWVMKRTPKASGSTTSVRLKLEQNGASREDPTDPDYIFTYFKCDKMKIFTKIGAASAEWQKDLYLKGGIVYLDAIMTIVEDGRPLGYMDENGMLHGEVYTTAAGIMNARDWADAEGLKTHFNKAVNFLPHEDLIKPPEGEDNKERLRISYGEQECRTCNEALIRAAPAGSEAFDVEKSIPTGEETYVTGQLQKFYYKGVLRHYFGTEVVPVEMNVTYTYQIETEEETITESFTNQVTYYAIRPYSYYRVEKLELYAIDRVVVENHALPESLYERGNLYVPRVVLKRNQSSYMKIRSVTVNVDGGDPFSGSCISSEQLQAIAEQKAKDITVWNDTFIIDGETILDGSHVTSQAPEPKQLSGERLQTFRSEDLMLPHTKRNGEYDTYGVAIYRDVLSGQTKQFNVNRINPVVVHTPVVCKGGVTDDIAHNQQITPTGYFSLVLGRSFAVGVSTVGTHKEQKGYGTRDYEKYTALRQVRFPFEVYDGDTRYSKDTWIDLPSGQKSFYLPPGVHEGDYRIRYRTVAKNAAAQIGGIDKNGYLANLQLSDYGAYDELTVTVIGRMYDLAVTDIVDYPRWSSVFYETNGAKKMYAFWVGRNDLEGHSFFARAAHGILPILPGDHPFQRSARAAGLGYRVKLQLKTIGDMRGDGDRIALIPTYYFISRDGSRRQRVRLYRNKDLTEVYQPLVLTASDRSFVPVQARNVSDPMLRAQSVQVWDGEYQLSPDLRLVDANIDLDSYIRQRGGRIGQRDPVFLRDGYLLVQFEVRSYPASLSQTGHLSYANAGNRMRGYCNMWRLQGFLYDRTDCFGNRFAFVDGDCLLFDTKYTLHSDYESWGTH